MRQDIRARSDSKHGIVVIGASAGELEVLQVILSQLPHDLPACLFVVATSVMPCPLTNAMDERDWPTSCTAGPSTMARMPSS